MFWAIGCVMETQLLKNGRNTPILWISWYYYNLFKLGWLDEKAQPAACGAVVCQCLLHRSCAVKATEWSNCGQTLTLHNPSSRQRSVGGALLFTHSTAGKWRLRRDPRQARTSKTRESSSNIVNPPTHHPALLCWFIKTPLTSFRPLSTLSFRTRHPHPHHLTVHWSCMLSQKLMPLDLWQLLCVSDIDIIVTVINGPLLRLWFRGLGQEALLLVARAGEIAHWCEETLAKSYITSPTAPSLTTMHRVVFIKKY